MKKLTLAIIFLAALQLQVGGQGTVQRRTASSAFNCTGNLDDFNRANENPLAGSFTQGFQGTGDGDLKLLSNQIEWATAGSTGVATATWNTPFNADQFVCVKITTRVGGSQHGVIGRANNAGASNVTGYQAVALTDTNLVRVIQWDSDVSGAFLSISGGATSVSQALTDGDSLGMKFSGTVGTLYYKVGAGSWTALGTFDASAYNASGKIGVGLYPSGSIADDFGGGNN